MKNKATVPICLKCKKKYKILNWDKFLQFIRPDCLETVFVLRSQVNLPELSKFEQAQKRFKDANPDYWRQYNKHYNKQQREKRKVAKC